MQVIINKTSVRMRFQLYQFMVPGESMRCRTNARVNENRVRKMATLTRRTLSSCIRLNVRYFNDLRTKKTGVSKAVLIGIPCSCLLAWKAFKHLRISGQIVPTVYAATDSESLKVGQPKTFREVRFEQFASVQYEGIIYMTPQDFLESVTDDVPRPRIGRTRLRKEDIETWLKNTPAKRRGSRTLFRSMHNKGLISYTEYLFLLCVLTKPQSGFRIAFNMFDTDGNQIVDKKEFLMLESFFTLPPSERKFVPREKMHLQSLLDLEGVFSKGNGDAAPVPAVTADENDSQPKSVEPIQDTTLLVHFFGRKGNDVLKFDDFHKFMTHLQLEIIELEFLEFSKGMQTISETDFARILLRYTSLDKTDINECLERVQKNTPEEKGITFEEFWEFSQFMNNLDDFTIAMNMYTYAEQPVSKEEFQRAVLICTGSPLKPHIVDTLFNIFDVDGDQHLSYKEFISIMKDRKYRGNRSHMQPMPHTWDAFKSCVKSEMKSYI